VAPRENQSWYYFLDEKHIPVECSKDVWTKAMKGKKHLMVGKSQHNKVITSFVSRIDKTTPQHMFKTTVYNNINAIIYMRHYDDYDSAISGHRLTIEERPWDTQR
jgi:hypothetical protein